MIHDVPTATDFHNSGKGLIDFAWDIVSELITSFNEAGYFGIDPDEISDEYWSASGQRLSTSVSILQQGVELILKGKISEISPFLLINDPPQKWPSPYKDAKILFSEFKTLEAQDLIKAHDTVSSSPLHHDFVDKYNYLRKIRNVLMHSVDRNISFSAVDVLESILYMHYSLYPNENWNDTRKDFLNKSQNVLLGSNEYITNNVCQETEIVINILPYASVKKYYKIDRKKRGYYCPKCLSESNRDIDFDHKLARLVTSPAGSSSVFCPVCMQQFEVVRKTCNDYGEGTCRANVISEEYGYCLTCGR